uniref:Endonuclease/exonuclease/phosphatase domain-containing protein n=1 Tax=Populus alba TaxID=43335 RepID=A0A4U5P506_POPAL|nr:hypothetical protein D5086_0000224700 [Populus alba]
MGSLADNPHDPGLNTAMQHDQLVDMRLLSVVPSTSITLEIQASNQTWSLSAIYTSPIPDPDQILVRGSWMLIGDCNEIILPSEIHGSPFSMTRADKFREVLAACNLLDKTLHCIDIFMGASMDQPPLSPMLGVRSGGRDVLRGLDTVREEPVIFNKMKFGNLFRRKRRSEAPLNGVQRRCTPFFHTLTMVVRKRNRVKRWF